MCKCFLFCFVGDAVALLFCASAVLVNQNMEKSFHTLEYLYNTRQACNLIYSTPTMSFFIMYLCVRVEVS